MEYSYTDFKEEAPTGQSLAAVSHLVEQIKGAEQELEAVGADLAKKQEGLRILTLQLSKLMEELKLKEFTTTSNRKVVMAEEIDCGISEQNKPAAYKWLEDNGHGGIIKRNIGVAF